MASVWDTIYNDLKNAFVPKPGESWSDALKKTFPQYAPKGSGSSSSSSGGSVLKYLPGVNGNPIATLPGGIQVTEGWAYVAAIGIFLWLGSTSFAPAVAAILLVAIVVQIIAIAGGSFAGAIGQGISSTSVNPSGVATTTTYTGSGGVTTYPVKAV